MVPIIDQTPFNRIPERSFVKITREPLSRIIFGARWLARTNWVPRPSPIKLGLHSVLINRVRQSLGLAITVIMNYLNRYYV